MLYDDIPLPKKTADAGRADAAIASAATAAPPQLFRGGKPGVRPSQVPARPNTSLNRSQAAAAIPGTAATEPDASRPGQASTASCIPEGGEEYDPMKPNSFAAIKRHLHNAPKRPRAVRPRGGDGSSTASDDSSDAGRGRDAELCGEEAFAPAFDPTPAQNADDAPMAANPAVSAMMQRMGYVQGQGLGVTKQGRLNPVVAAGNDGRGGLGKSLAAAQELASAPGSSKMRNGARPKRVERSGASRVLLVRNLPAVGSAVDELRHMCAPLGQLDDIVVGKEDARSDGEDGASVARLRAIVAFQDGSSSVAALLALDGRRMHGSELRVTMYSEALFLASRSGGKNESR
jgi:hypothetical protein